MNISTNQRGSSHLVLLLGLLVISVAGFVGYRVMQVDSPIVSTAPALLSSDGPKTIKSSADLKKAESALDNTAIDGGVNPGALDSDLNAVN